MKLLSSGKSSFLNSSFSQSLSGLALLGLLAANASLVSAETTLSSEAPSTQSILTPLGAIRAGNTNGTIPEWTGGITTPPATYIPGGRHTDPFPDDAIVDAVSWKNLDQYQHMLSKGVIRLLKQKPDFKINIYPSRRTASVPQAIYDSSQRNAGSAELSFRGDGVSGAVAGTPFPVPRSGQEAIWNHTMRYRGQAIQIDALRAVIQPDGKVSSSLIDRQLWFNYNRQGVTHRTLANTLFYYKQETLTPEASAGNILLLKEPIDQIITPRQAWFYSPKLSKVKRLPQRAYDDIMPNTDNILTSDSVDMFNGALDRYEWKLLDRKEMVVPYNSYKLHSGDLTYDEILQPAAMNPALLRYELHRVWIVEAELRTGFNHMHTKRRFYLDEDSWQILMVDIYDKTGKLVRYQEAHPINYYSVPAVMTTAEVTYDLQNGRYFVDGLSNQEKERDFNPDVSRRDFTASGMRKEKH